MHIKLKEKLKLTHAQKYKAIKFKLRCDYNVNIVVNFVIHYIVGLLIQS